MQNKILIHTLLIVLMMSLGISFSLALDNLQSTTKILMNPYYRPSMALGVNYTYDFSLNPPDKISNVVTALVTLQIYINPTVTVSVWVNNTPCNTPSYTVSTTYAGASQSIMTFDCSNVITKKGSYILKVSTSKASGVSTAWLDVTYNNNQSDYVGTVGNVDSVESIGSIDSIDSIKSVGRIDEPKMTVHGTEYTYGQTAKVWLQLLDANDSNIDTAVCYADIYTPLGGYYIEGATMTNMVHDGIYYYDLTVPIRQGVYPTIAKCYFSAGQDKRVASSFALTSGSVDSGTYLDTQTLNTIYHKINTNKNGGLTVNNRINVTYTFSDFFTYCGNVSELLVTGLTIYWNGIWNTGTVNHDITLYVYNYSSSSWITFSNKILGGSGGATQFVSNSITTNNFTKSLGISSVNPMMVKFADNDINEPPKKLSNDYIYASCDQLSNAKWQQLKGSSELHITNPEYYTITTEDDVYTINNSITTTLANGSIVSETYYTGIFINQFEVSSGSLLSKDVIVEYQGLHSIPCNSIISFYKINSSGYYQYPFTTQRQTEEDHCSINFELTLEYEGVYNFEVHARNVWESEIRSTNTGLGAIYPLLNAGCTLWQIAKGNPAYIIPKNGTNEQYDYYYRACANMYDDYYWFNKTYQQSLIDKPLIADEQTFLQYESDYTSLRFAEEKLNTITIYLLNNLQVVNDYSKLLIEHPLGDSVVNTTDQRYWASQSTLYNAWRIVNASCGTGVCNTNVTFIADNVWNTTNRNLTYYPVQTVSVNTTAIAESVWSWEGNIVANILDRIGTAIWEYLGARAEII